MADNVIYGVVFGKVEHAVVPIEWVDDVLMQQDDFRRRYLQAHPDTSPSEYTAPDGGDCA